MLETIAFVGGDYRNIKLLQILKKDGYSVKTFGLEKSQEVEESEKYCGLKDTLDNVKKVISSIPFSKDGENVFMPYSDKVITIEDFKMFTKGKSIIAGNIIKYYNDEIEICNKCDNWESKLFDIMQKEPFTISNAISTAEGAIQIAMENTEFTIHNSKILVLGFGRIGKILCDRLKSFGANVTCEARKKSDLAWIEVYGYKSVHLDYLNEYLNEFDIIFNTIPYLIINRSNLEYINKNCLIIDLASKPGGVDFKECKKYGIKAIHALALPRKSCTKDFS